MIMADIPSDIFEKLQLVWDYNLMQMPIKKADVILVLGSNDLRVADRAVELYDQGWADKIIFSGAQGRLTSGGFDKTEAETFAEIALSKGVPKERVFLEKEATNTGENLQFTKALIKEHKLEVKSAILVQKPYMERRTYATAKKQWPTLEFTVSSPKLNLREFLEGSDDVAEVIEAMLGDLHRIKIYAVKGYQIPQEIPIEVWDAFEELRKMAWFFLIFCG
jgi:uncharacterized SAM-binding protein YcdF (DUF218 family)